MLELSIEKNTNKKEVMDQMNKTGKMAFAVLLMTGVQFVSSAGGHLEDQRSAAAERVSAMPEVLLIGDSIRMGYCGDAGRELGDAADVRWPKENCSNSQNILIQLPRWRGLVSNPKVVQFNCGHWDASRWVGDEEPITSVEEYGKNLRLIVRRLRRDYPDAKLVFATTTRMNPNGVVGRNIRTTDDIRRYNAKAKEVMAAEKVVVNDLFAATENWPSADFADYCHFTKEANRRLGKLVADFLRKQL